MTYIDDKALYERVQLFSGGGYRFGYYLGSYAALCDYGLKPDLILATCGGSLASLLVDVAPDPQQLKLLMESETLYKVIRASQSFDRLNIAKNRQLSKPRYFYQAVKRMALARSQPRLTAIHQRETQDELLAELNHYAMLEIDGEDSWLNDLVTLKDKQSITTGVNPDIAIIASRILPVITHKKNHPDSNIQIKANGQQDSAKLQEVLFTPYKLREYLKQSANCSYSLQCPTHQLAPRRIAKAIHIVDKWDIKQAIRASMADMYYLQPTHIPNLGWCLGGVIDLTPIELAAKFGNTVFAETKADYDKALAVPAIKRVFGFDPNQRLKEVLSFVRNNTDQPIHWLPFADNGKMLAGQYVQKRIDLRRGQIDLIHADYDGFIKQMQAQWQYGYKRTAEYLQANF